MKLVYEYQSGAMTYGASYEVAGKTVVTREIRHGTGEPRKEGNTKKRAFATAALAEKFVRLCASVVTAQGWLLVEGTAPKLDPAESFRDVKEKSKAYRYFEHADGRFLDLDLDSSVLLVTRGQQGTAGASAHEETNWEGEAKEAYVARTREALGEGFVLKEGTLSKAELKASEPKKPKAKTKSAKR